MDFNSLLNTASKNAKNVDKTLADLDSKVAKERKEQIRQIETERLAKIEQVRKKKAIMAARREPTPEKKFTIPKKKKEEPTVDRSKVLAFLAKKEQEKAADMKQKQVEKEKLIQMRLHTFGGKANKKMEKHFGIDAMDIQIRYGNDHTHVERLQKQKWREEEEQDMMADQYRGGVYKAIQQRNKALEHASSSGSKKEPHRVSTSKSNSLAGLSSRHASSRDHFSPPRDGKKKEGPKPTHTSSHAQKKRPPPPAVDFGALMKAAEDISQGKKVNLNSIEGPKPAKIPRMDASDRPSSSSTSSSSSLRKSAPPTSSSSSSRAPSSSSKPLPSGFTKPSSSTKMSAPSSSYTKPPAPTKRPDPPVKSKAVAKPDAEEKPTKKEHKGRFVKAPTPPPAIPLAIPGKKYLPGDVRYKQQQEMMRNGGGAPSPPPAPEKRPESSKVSSTSSSRECDQRKNRGEYSKQRDDYNKSKAPISMRKPDSSNRMDRQKMIEMEQRRRAIEKQRRKREERERYERMSLVERERERDRQKWREEYGDVEEDDEEYDSDLDDFIDDSGMDFDELSRQEFEDTLKMVNPKYNQNRWKERERMISERDMVSDYRTIAREEARSARLGFMEDLYEAKKNKSEAL